MALRITEFFGYTPLDPAGLEYAKDRRCPFVEDKCIKPKHGACSVQQTGSEPVICCPNRLYGSSDRVLQDIAHETFGPDVELVRADHAVDRRRGSRGGIKGNEVAVFGR